MTTIPEVATCFLLIAYVYPTTIGLGGGTAWRGRDKGFAAPLSIAFNIRGHAAIRCSGVPHHMHLLVPNRYSGVV